MLVKYCIATSVESKICAAQIYCVYTAIGTVPIYLHTVLNCEVIY